LRRGDTRAEDDKVFWRYMPRAKNGQQWVTQEYVDKQKAIRCSPSVRKYYSDYNKRNRRSNPLFRMTAICRKRIWAACSESGFKKSLRTEEMLGCSFIELKSHLEAQFSEGMTFDNMGKYGWHVEHRIPLAAGRTPEEVERLCHYTNLQPMWSNENLSKGDKYNIEDLESFLNT